MAHVLVRYHSVGEPSWGQLTGPAPLSANDIVEVQPLKGNPKTTRELIALSSGRWEFGKTLRIGASQLVSPVTPDSRLVCQGLNYQEHAAEAQQATRRSNLILPRRVPR